MAVRTSISRSARSRRHHPYDTPFRTMQAPPHVPATDRTGAWIFAALSLAVMAAAGWAGLEQLLG